jgi:hypothetical protein
LAIFGAVVVVGGTARYIGDSIGPDRGLTGLHTWAAYLKVIF